MTNYVIASSKNWFNNHIKSTAYNNLKIFEIQNKNDLNIKYLESINPRYIFFPHWNWRVDSEIYERYECVLFHTAPLPVGRGGSPIQNLIINGFTSSPVCAVKMTGILDGGPIYDSLNISLKGTIEEIFSRIAVCVEKLIISICTNNPQPIEQKGEPTLFKRLKIKDNELLPSYSLNELYDRIRMVDGLDYPRAFINYGAYRLEFTNARIINDQLQANALIYLNI